MWFPSVLEIRTLRPSGTPVARVPLILTLRARRKNDYHLITISDANGSGVVTREDALRKIDETQQLFLMDYASELGECYPVLDVRVMDRESLERAIGAHVLFKVYPEETEEMRSLPTRPGFASTTSEHVFTANTPGAHETISVLVKHQDESLT